MTRSIAALSLVLLLTAVNASSAPQNEDALLTADGTLFVVRTLSPGDDPGAVDVHTGSALLLTSARDGQTSAILVPGSVQGGMNLDPALAWDPVDQRLYVVWQRRPVVASGEIVVTSLKQGRWSNEVVVGGGTWSWRQNLRIALTLQAQREDRNGAIETIDSVTLHAVWWNQEDGREQATHAMFTLEDGAIIAHPSRALLELVTRSEENPTLLPHDFDRNILRSPLVLETADNSELDVYFADWSTGTFHLVTLVPREGPNGRLRIPIGIADRRTDPPLLNRATDGLEISRPARGGSSFLVYTIGNEALEYVRFVDGRAEPPRTIDLDHDVTVERARAALDRLARSIQ